MKKFAVLILFFLTSCYGGKEITYGGKKIPLNSDIKSSLYSIPKSKKFSEKTFAERLSYNKHQQHCNNEDSSKNLIKYKTYTDCLYYGMKVQKFSFSSVPINKFELSTFFTITDMHEMLVKYGIYTDEKAYENLNKILKMQSIRENEKSFSEDVLLASCKNSSSKTFIKCLDNNIRDQEIYIKSSIFTRSIIEQIITFSYLHYEGIYHEPRFKKTQKEIRNSENFESDKYFLSAVDYFASKYHNDVTENLSDDNKGIMKSLTSKITKTDYVQYVKDIDKQELFFNTLDAAIFLWTVHEFSNGSSPLQKILKDKKTTSVPTKSFTGSGKSASVLSANNTSIYRKNMFRYVPQNSVLNKSWFKYGLLRGGF